MLTMQHLKNEKGLSLVELLATIVITVMIGMIGYAILFNGYKTYERVKVEAHLRDEADLIMAELINDLFTLKVSEIVKTYLPQSNSTNYFIQLKEGKKVGFIDGKILRKDGSQYIIHNESIKLSDQSKIVEIEQGQYRIFLTLEWTKSNQTLTTESEIGIVLDKE